MSRLRLCVDAILHLAPPAGPKGRTYDLRIYTNTGTLISLEELSLLAIIDSSSPTEIHRLTLYNYIHISTLHSLYMLEVVLEEVNATTTYEHFAENYSKLVNEHLKFMTASRIVVQPDCRCLPQFYWLPKIHKKPYGASFIAASKTCTTKPLSKLLTSGLKLITNHFRQYCNGIFVGLESTVFGL